MDGAAIATDTSIFREPTAAEAELALQRLRLHRVRQELAARELALGDLRRHLISFEGRYLRQVGLLYRQLDEWERRFTRLQIADASLDDLEAELAASFEDDLNRIVSPEPPNTRPQHATVDLRALFRELARRIHPDHAATQLDESRRTRLMAQANDAYRRKDPATLQRMLDGFEVSATPLTPDAELPLVLRQIELIEQDIVAVEAIRDTLMHSEHAQLEASVLAAALEGRDLLAEMAARVQGQIGIAMARYERELHRRKHPTRGLRARDVVTAETRVTLKHLKRR